MRSAEVPSPPVPGPGPRRTDAPARAPRAARDHVLAALLTSAVACALAVGPGVPVRTAPTPAEARTTTACTLGGPGCEPRVALGVGTVGLPTSTAGLYAFEQALGRDADVALTFTSFRYAFDVAGLRALAERGTTPLITWEPWDPTVPQDDRYPLAEIAAGTHDAYLREQARRLREVGHPVALRFAHEMNATWYPWGVDVRGNTAEDYVAAYRHVHDVLTQEGVTDVTWVWSPATADDVRAADLRHLYPGDAYVDAVGVSVYFDDPTDTWRTTAQPTVDALRQVAPGAPVLVAEAGVLPGPRRVAMVRDLLDGALAVPEIAAVTWLDVDSREDWRVSQDPAALDALRTALDDGR